ncbi:MAG TPA: tautomerase family protein [Mycobacteriales bacterium]|nr:tautomerase family protein [Mycobacteriales bacterium]
MPLVRIDLLSDVDTESTDKRLAAVGDAVHQAMTETIDVPRDDVFQIRTSHRQGGVRYDPGYLGVNRDDGIVFVNITMRVGRTDAQKKALYRRISELAAERVGIEPRNVLTALTENQSIDWSFGEGAAQLA